jgi:hypothetical protein
MTETIIAKLVEARKDFQPFGKNRQAYNYKYADLDEIISATGPALLKHGLSVHTSSEAIEIAQKPWLIVTACLSDKFGQEIKASIPMPLENVTKAKVPAQDMWSIITYGRRYAYCALLNLTADEDIDAGPGTEQQKPAPIASSKPPIPPKTTLPSKIQSPREKNLGIIRNYIVKHGKEFILQTLDISDLALINSWDDTKLDDCVDFLLMTLGEAKNWRQKKS